MLPHIKFGFRVLAVASVSLASKLGQVPCGPWGTLRAVPFIVPASLATIRHPFVAGQMDYCMDNTAVFLPVLVGFNPVSMAR